MPYDTSILDGDVLEAARRPLPTAAGIADCLLLLEEEAAALGLDAAKRLLGAVAVAVMEEALARHGGISPKA
jgi:hypothetical protein